MRVFFRNDDDFVEEIRKLDFDPMVGSNEEEEENEDDEEPESSETSHTKKG